MLISLALIFHFHCANRFSTPRLTRMLHSLSLFQDGSNETIQVPTTSVQRMANLPPEHTRLPTLHVVPEALPTRTEATQP